MYTGIFSAWYIETYPVKKRLPRWPLFRDMIVKVLPQFSSIYDGIDGAKLPFITTALLAVSNFIIHPWMNAKTLQEALQNSFHTNLEPVGFILDDETMVPLGAPYSIIRILLEHHTKHVEVAFELDSLFNNCIEYISSIFSCK